MRVHSARVLAGIVIVLLVGCIGFILLSDHELPGPTNGKEQLMRSRRSLVERGCYPSASLAGYKNPMMGPLTIRAVRTSLHSDKDTEDQLLQGYKHLIDNPLLLNHLIVDDHHKSLYCYVPKVACTNWKRLMMIMSGYSKETDPYKIPADSVHRKGVLNMLYKMKPAEILHRLQTYKKFLIARDPLERTLSAFRNKFEKNYTSSAYFKKRFGVKIQKMFRRGSKSSSVSPTGDGTTFPEFTNYLIQTGQFDPTAFNEHWAPIVQLCQPCLVRYDYIGKYETISSDTEFILSSLGAPPNLKLPESKTSVTNSRLPGYLAKLTPTQRKELHQVYADDIILFGYSYREN